MKWVAKLENMPSKKGRRIIPLLLLLLCFLFYANSLSNGYAIDDEYVTVTNPTNVEHPNHPFVSKGFSGIPDIFGSSYVIEGDQNFGYRPIVLTTYAIEYAFFGANAGVSHFVNIVLYALVALLIYVLIRRVFEEKGRWLALIVSAFWVIHPMHTEVVNNLKSRDELLCMTFGLLASLCFVSFVKTKRWWLIGAGLLTLSLAFLSKETALAFLGIIPLLMYFKDASQWKVIGMITVLVLLVVVGFNRVRMSALQDHTNREYAYYENPLLVEPDQHSESALASYVYGWYSLHMLVPVKQVSYYGFEAIEMQDWTKPLVWVSAVFHLLLLLLGLVWLRRKHPVSLGVLLYIGVLFGFSNLMKPIVGIVADRFTFIASLGFSLAIGWCIWYGYEKLKDKKANNLLIGGLALLLIGFAIITWNRNSEWKDKLTLFAADVAKAPRSAKLHTLYASALTEYGSPFKIEEARFTQQQNMLVQQAASQGQTYVPERYSVAMAPILEQVKSHYQSAIEIYPEYGAALNNLAHVYLQYEQDGASAQPLLERSVAVDSSYLPARLNLAYCMVVSGDLDGAAGHYHYVQEHSNEYPDAYTRLADAYINKGEYALAVDEILSYQQAFPDGLDMLTASMDGWIKGNELGKAEGFAIAVLEKVPDNLKARETLLRIYHHLERKEQALSICESYKTIAGHETEGFEFMSKLYLSREQYLEATEINQIAFEQFPEKHIFPMTVGDILTNTQQDIRGALVWYDRAIALQPNDAGLLKYVARNCKKYNLEAEANAYLARASALESGQ